jgi:imidazole glycerol-phosphate synthase subunit HisF
VLRPRIIPCLLVHNGGLVKTIRFSEPKYVGDPLNTVRIFNEKEVDELIVADIDATVLNREPNYSLIAHLAAESRMPLCYAGGIRNPEQVERIISLGVEKVAIGTSACASTNIVAEAARRVGSQSVVVVLDAKRVRSSGRYELFTHRGQRSTGLEAADFARRVESAGAGEILVNSIDQDGVMKGYELALIDLVRNAVRLPLTVMGGAGSIGDISAVFRRHGIIGAAAGSLFVFKGRFRAVLLQYPSRAERDVLFTTARGL